MKKCMVRVVMVLGLVLIFNSSSHALFFYAGAGSVEPLTYDAGSNILSQFISPEYSYDLSYVTNATWNLQAEIDDGGNLIDGSILLEGDIADLSIFNQTLLSGRLIKFDYGEDAIGGFEFGYSFVTYVISVHPSLNFLDSYASIYLQHWPNIPDDLRVSGQWFTQSHSAIPYTGSSIIGLGVVPEPTTILLMGIGIIGIAGYSRKKFRK